MSLPLFPVSPLPADLGRIWQDGVTDAVYDNGARQASTAFTKPLLNYTIPMPAILETRESSLTNFFFGTGNRFGQLRPFLLKDPYLFQVTSVLGVRSGITVGTLFMYDTNSFSIRPDTTTIGSMFSALSTYVRLGFDYQLDQDSGILTVNTKASNDIWGVRSIEYFRKFYNASPYANTGKIWNVFALNISLKEMP